MTLVLAGAALVLLGAGPARAAGTFFIRGGGDGHGIGMSQYGAYGYALHGLDYRAILAHYYRGTALGQTDPQQTVRVLLATGKASFSGGKRVGGAAGPTLSPPATYTVIPAGANRLKLVSASGKPVGGTYSAPLTITGTSPLAVPGLGGYRGSLEFRPDGHGGVQTVDALGLDDYVRGVVAAEMPSSWAAQALEAQAVAARTYAITATVNGAGYDLYGDTRSQMYGGVGAETSATNAAVGATSGQIVTYRGHPAVTYFFASSGGHTESIQNVWSGSTPEPWLTGVADPYDGAGHDPYHHWGVQMTAAAAAARLGSLVRGSLVGIAVTTHGASPRILQASVVGTQGRSAVSGDTLQRIFNLPTTNAAFTIVSTVGTAGGVSGTVFPAPGHGTVAVQVANGGGWQKLRTVALTRGGAFTAAGLSRGRYRIFYAGLDGPTVAVH